LAHQRDGPGSQLVGLSHDPLGEDEQGPLGDDEHGPNLLATIDLRQQLLVAQIPQVMLE
jgi:hypothetical protein